MLFNTLRALTAGAVMVVAGQAAVATTTVTMTGTTSSSQVSGTSSTFTATMVYDETATTPTSTGGANSGGYNYNYAYYNALMSLSFTSGTINQTINVTDATSNSFRVLDSANSNVSDNEYGTIYLGNKNYIQALFSGVYTTLSSDAIVDPTAFAGSTNNAVYYENANGNLYVGRVTSYSVAQTAANVPEPATWGMMILGFGAIGATMRNRQRTVGVSFN